MENFESILFQDGDFELEVRLDKENKTIWLTQEEISLLLDRPRTTISYYINTKLKEYRQKVGSYDEKFVKRSGYKPKVLYDFEFIQELGKYINTPRFDAFLKEMKLYLNDNALSILDNEDIIYDNGTIKLSINFSPKEETVWLSQKQIASLFGLNRSVVTKHIQNIIEEKELEISVGAKNAHTELSPSEFLWKQ